MDNTHTVNRLTGLDDWQLEHQSEDLRGQTLYDTDGGVVGKVDDMLADTTEERIVALRLDDDRVVDIDCVDIRDGVPVLLVGNDRIPAASADFDRDNITREAIPIVEERMNIGKREVELGKVRIRTRVVSDDVSEDVALREEHVRVDRRDVNQAISAADADTLLKEGTVELTETGERVVVEKSAMVTGEVRLDKDVDTRTEHVEGTVRRTEVDVDRDDTVRDDTMRDKTMRDDTMRDDTMRDETMRDDMVREDTLRDR